MAENIEIEFKNLLTEQEFDQLCTQFNLRDSQFSEQINHYFDTEQFLLKSLHAAVRIREKNGQFEFTLKQPLPSGEGLLETNQTITTDEAKNACSKGVIPTGEVADKLQQLIPNPLAIQYFGQLTTVRAETEYNGGLLVFDKSSYLDQTDFELEFEVTDYHAGLVHFNQLLTSTKIPVRKTENKVERFYRRMQTRVE